MRVITRFVCLFLLAGLLPIYAAQLNFLTSQVSVSGNSINPNVAINDNGQIMTVWWESSSNRIMARLFTPGSGYGNIIEIPGQGSPSAWPRIKGGVGSEFHVVWSAGYSEHFHDILYSHYANGAFSTAQTIQSSSSAWPDLCYNRGTDTVSVCWEEYVGGDNGEIMVRQRRAGRWGSKVVASTNTPLWSGHAKITCDDAGNLYAVWYQKTQIGAVEIIEAYYNRTIGGAWQASVAMTNDRAWRFLPNVAVNPSGTEVFVQWYSYSDKYHWGRAITYNGNQPTYGQAQPIIRGSLDHLHYHTGMVYQGDTLYFASVGGDGQVWLKDYRAGVWGEGGTIPGVSCPRTVTLNQSASLGLALSWYDTCQNTVYMSYGEGSGPPPPPPPPPPKPNKPPVARIVVNPAEGIYPLTTTISGTTSSDSDGTITSYTWTLGDGAGASLAEFNHVYQRPGTYAISLTISDDDGATASASASVTVYGIEPPLNIRSNYHQNRNLFSIEHYYRVNWANNPVNEQRNFNITRYQVFRRLKGAKSYQYLATTFRKDNNEYLDRSLNDTFFDYEYTVICIDSEGRQSDLPTASQHSDLGQEKGSDHRAVDKVKVPQN